MDGGDTGGARPSSTVERLGQLALLLLFLFAIAGGVVLLVERGQPGGVEVVLPTVTPIPSVQVYVTGAVAEPGVYTLQDRDRLQDAVKLAGGATADADLARVNLALLVQDEGHYHVPAVGEDLPVAPSSQAAGTSSTNLNTASLAELMALPGIGEVRANAILEHRERNGPFRSVDDLVDVSGIGRGTLESIQDLVTAE